MEYAEWIELDNEFLSFNRQKTARIIERGEKCCYTAPDAYPAALELLEELAEYLPARYPSLFKRTEVGIDNLATGERFNIIERPLCEDPMVMAARWVQDDLAIMMEGPDGVYYLKAGATLLTGFWRLQDKLGMSLDDIHLSGDVPGFRQKLQKGMNNFFTRLQPEAPMLRNNYFIQVDGELPWSSSIGSEDSKEGEFGWFTAEKDKPIDQMYFRSERQSLRRLPKTGGVVGCPAVCLREYAHVDQVFTIRTYFAPIMEIAKEPYVPGRLASGIRSWDDDVAKYKGLERYGKVLLEYLDREHQRQLDAGLPLDKEEEVRSYPW
jgi:alpha-1,2-mannosyltransferase